MVRREIRRNTNKFGKLFEPFAILLLMLLFTIPVLAVMNLSPQTGSKPNINENVLGITVESKEIIDTVGGTHEYITDEKLFDESETQYRYQATILNRDAGTYTKPALIAQNTSDKNITIKFSLVKDEASSSQLGLMVENRNFVVKATNGEKFLQEFELAPGEKVVFYLDVRNELLQNFEETIELKIDIIGLIEEIPEELTEQQEDQLGVTTSELVDETTNLIEEELPPLEEDTTPVEAEEADAPVGAEIDTEVYVNE